MIELNSSAACSCGSDKECADHLRLKRAEQLRRHWWTYACRLAREYLAAGTVQERTIAWRALRRVPKDTAMRALYAEARP